MARIKRKINPLRHTDEVQETARTEQRIYRAAGYVRLSLEDSGRPGADTIESQMELVRNYIEAQPDMEFTVMHCDNGHTGTSFSRPGFDSLMQDVKDGKADCIVVKDLSRFGRNYREAGNYIERIFPFMGVRFVALTDNFDTLHAERTDDGYIVPLKNMLNEMYSRDMSKKVSSALSAKQKRGELIGAVWAVYGYRKCADDPHKIEPDEETAPVVQEMFRMWADGMSYYKIIQELNRRGIPAPSRYHYLKGDTKCGRYADVVWQPQVARKILCNEVYLGHMVQGRWRRSFYEEKQRHTVPEQEWVVVHNTHEPLVDENTFRIVQDMAAKQKAGYLQRLGKHDGLGKKPNILRKLIFCAECGKAMAYKRSVYDNGKKKTCYYNYICPSYENDKESCRVKGIREETLMDTLQELLKKQAALAAEMSVKAAGIRSSVGRLAEDAAWEQEYRNDKKELERLRMLYDSLYPMYADEKALTEQEYMRMKQDYRMRIGQAEKVLGDLEEKKRARAAQMDENPWLKACTAYRNETVITEKMAHALISRIEVHADKRISVSLRWQDEFRKLVQALETEGGAYTMINAERTGTSAGRLKAAMYLRISSEDSDIRHSAKTESDSIANQRSLLSAFISRMPELENADILEFCDDGWSGKNFDRPAVREMLEQARKGGIQCILVKDLSRFGRDYLEVGNYISRIFPFLGIRFIAVNDHFDSSRGLEADSLETSFKTLFHDIYSRDISKKVREAKRFRAERGEFINSFAPYGYIKDPQDKKHLVIDPEAAQSIRRIFRMAVEKKSSTEIARALNADCVPTPMQYKRAAGCSRTWICAGENNFWTRDTVNHILRDERYIGTNIFGRRMCDEIGKNHMVSIPRAEWIRVAGCHEGIVTDEEFASAQENLREYKEYSKNGPGSRLFWKKVRCGVCGHIMYYFSGKKPYYICNTPRVTDGSGCPEERLAEEELLDAVRDGLRTQALYAVDAAQIWEEKHRRKQCDVKGMRAELFRLAESCTVLDTHTRDLYEKFAFGELGREEYLSEKRATAEKKERVSVRMEELEEELQNAGEDGRLENRFTDSFGKYTEVEELTADIIEDVLQEIVVYPSHVLRIAWNYQDDLKKLLLDIGMDGQNGKSI